MFIPVDVETWPRREVYAKFLNYTYSVTVPLDITHFLAKIKAAGLHFYPAISHLLTRVINLPEHRDYRYSVQDGVLGYWDKVDTHYTLLRTGTDLFTHTVTQYSDDVMDYHARFMEDKRLAEAGDSLYYNNTSPLDSFHLTIMPNLPFSAISFSKPATFTGANSSRQGLMPFAIIGQYQKQDGKTVLPLAVEFHHAINDGLHAGRLFEAFGRALAEFRLS